MVWNASKQQEIYVFHKGCKVWGIKCRKCYTITKLMWLRDVKRIFFTLKLKRTKTKAPKTEHSIKHKKKILAYVCCIAELPAISQFQQQFVLNNDLLFKMLHIWIYFNRCNNNDNIMWFFQILYINLKKRARETVWN